MAFLHKWFGCPASTSRKQPSTTLDYLCRRFSLAQIRKWTDDFDESREIGEGRYSVVYRACISINGDLKDIALKRLRQRATIAGLSEHRNEIIFSCQLHHPNLASLVGFCYEKNETIAIYDYAPNGTLFHQLRSNSPTLSWKKRLQISIGVARGLHYLHSGTKRTVIHRDIKPSNILLDENWVAKVTYFGIAVKGPKFSEKNEKPKEVEIAGTVLYIAPECLKDLAITYKCDVHSFGVVLLDLICGDTASKILFEREARNVKELCNLGETGATGRIIDQNLGGEIAEECWELYMDIVRSCLSENPNERPHMGDVEVQLERILELQEEADTNHA